MCDKEMRQKTSSIQLAFRSWSEHVKGLAADNHILSTTHNFSPAIAINETRVNLSQYRSDGKNETFLLGRFSELKK